MAIGILASIARRGVEGVKPVGTKETLPSLREETRSRFKPSKQVEPKLPGRFVPPDKR
jgi:rod shape-determining protein rodA family protein